MKHRKNKTLPALLAGAALLAAQANAAVLFTDDFSATGSGSGFAAASSWSAGTLAGGEITVTSTTSYRNLTSSIDTSTMDFWFVTNLSMTTGGWGGISFYAGTNEDGFFGSDTASTTWEFDTDGISDTNTSITSRTGNMTLLIAHITGTSIDMWIDPADTSSVAALGTADASNTTNPITPNGSWTRLRIGAGGQTVKVDDMTAATTFGEAIPEPSVILLAGLIAPAMLLRRRRR